MSDKRLVLLLGPGGAPELERAMELANQLGARLEAYLLEDEQLRRAANLTFLRETGLTSAITRTLNPVELDRQLQIARSIAERLLAETARRYAVEWSLSIQNERTSEQLLAAERSADWLVVSESCFHGSRAIWRQLLGGGLTTREVFVLRSRPMRIETSARTAVLAFSEPNEHAVGIARQIADKLQSPSQLAVFLPRGVEASGLVEGDTVLRFPSDERDPAQLLLQMRQAGAAAVIAIVPQSSDEIDREMLESLVALSTLPIAILTAPGDEPG